VKCVRCRRDSASVIAKAPDGSGAWEVYHCTTCHFSWRDTDEEEVTNPDKYDERFRLDKIDFDQLKVSHPIRSSKLRSS
jgi:hypothetical protein